MRTRWNYGCASAFLIMTVGPIEERGDVGGASS